MLFPLFALALFVHLIFGFKPKLRCTQDDASAQVLSAFNSQQFAPKSVHPPPSKLLDHTPAPKPLFAQPSNVALIIKWAAQQSSQASTSHNEPFSEQEDDYPAETSSSAACLSPIFEESVGDEAKINKEMKMLGDIEAIKKIIGYHGVLHASLVEQIRALYKFVGMEPSASVVNMDELEMATAELEVLKAVIGIK